MAANLSRDDLIEVCNQFEAEEPNRIELLEATDECCGYYDT